MISLPLLKSTIRSQYPIFLIFAAILALYLAIIASLFDPESMAAFDAILATLPKEIVSAMHFSFHETSLTGFLAGYFYGFLILLIPLIYTVITANHVIASYVDSGSMAFLLSTPNPRWKIALTQAVYLAGSAALLIVFTMLAGIAVSQAPAASSGSDDAPRSRSTQPATEMTPLSSTRRSLPRRACAAADAARPRIAITSRSRGA